MADRRLRPSSVFPHHRCEGVAEQQRGHAGNIHMLRMGLAPLGYMLLFQATKSPTQMTAVLQVWRSPQRRDEDDNEDEEVDNEDEDDDDEDDRPRHAALKVLLTTTLEY